VISFTLLLLPLLGFFVVTIVTSVGISCCYCYYLCWDFLLLLYFLVVICCYLVFYWSILGLFLVEYTGFIWLLVLCTQVWCIDLEAQGDQSWLGVRDFIKLKKCKGRGLVNYKDLLLSHILIKYQD